MKRAVVATFCTLAIACQAQGRRSDALKAYTICQFDDGLKVASVDRLPPSVQSRSVDTRNGSKQASMADGYRIMLAYPDTNYFVNLKVEMSRAGMFPSDKEAIIEQMKSISSQATGSAMPLEHTRMRGLDAFALNNSTLSGGVLSMYSLFDDKKGIVITADMLNQEPERRKFQTIEAYRILRDRFLTRYAACVASHGG